MVNIRSYKMFEPFFGIYFIWYYLPIARAMFSSTLYNLMFFGFYICGFLLLIYQIIYDKKKIVIKSNLLTPILIYMFIALMLYLFDVKDMYRHIRISFTFWGTLLLFFSLSLYKEARIRLAKLMIILIVLTAFTSVIGVMVDPHAARTLTFSENALEEDILLKMKNIADIFFFQGLVICVPLFITNIFKRKRILLSTFCIGFILFALLSASFTISLILFFVAAIVTILFNVKTIKAKICMIVVGGISFFLPWAKIFIYLAGRISNTTISAKLETLIAYGINGIAAGGLESRMDLYIMSLRTFCNNPQGVGPEYKFSLYTQGIGYHSQILDDMARYGVLAIVFYVLFFSKYYDLLKIQWGKVEMKQISFPITFTYFLFLLLNPGFTSPYEGVLLMFVLLTFPEILQEKIKKKK